MKKLFLALLILIVLGGVAVYLASGWVLERATREALPRAQAMLSRQGIQLEEVDYAKVGLQSYNQIAWSDIRATVGLPPNASGYDDETAQVTIDQVSVRLEGFSFKDFQLVATGLEAGIVDELSDDFSWASSRFREAAQNGRVSAPYVSFDLSVDRSDPVADLRFIYKELLNLVREGTTAIPAEINASVETVLDGAPIGVRLKTVPAGEGSALQVDRDDLARQAEHFSRKLTDAEIDVVAEHPMRAPRLLFLKKYAENTAAAASQNDRSVPEDAYRHVLWSFLLTREYGPDFAERVTDAHEIGSTTNTEADHRMDYNNNGVGRTYAAEGVAESEILARVKSAPNIIRTPV